MQIEKFLGCIKNAWFLSFYNCKTLDMELFTINRFRPSAGQEKAAEAEQSILQKLKNKAAKKQTQESHIEEEVIDEVDKTETKKKKRKKEKEKDEQEVKEAEECVIEKKPKKKKLKTAKTIEENHASVDGTAEEVKKNEGNEEGFDSAIGSSEEQEKVEEEPAFTLLGEIEIEKQKPVKRVLPYWLDKPSVISSDLQNKEVPVENLQGLSTSIVNNLKRNGINHFFPVQQHIIPRLLTSESPFRPNDMCVSAPTGSGKTLAFVLPLIQALSNRTVRRVRALVVLPVHDLAVQVHRVFQQYLEGTGIKVCLISGQLQLSVEQENLVRTDRLGRTHSLADIVVATPGRLVDHIEKTVGFDLTNLRYLVIDEADRILEESHSDWLQHVEAAVYKNGRTRLAAVTAKHIREVSMYPPLQKLLFSATLTSNPEKLRTLQLFQPELYTSVVMKTDQDEDFGQFVGKYTTPKELTELYYVCDLTIKPLVVQHLILKHGWKSVLCFHSSRESTHRLSVLLNELGRLKASEFSAELSKQERVKMLREFASGAIQVLVCTDAVARGMDLGVDAVISYDPPMFPKNYIHRVGRTARAGKEGTAVTLLLENQKESFMGLLATVHKSHVQQSKIDDAELYEYEEEFKRALGAMKNVLTNEELSDKKSTILKRKGMKHGDRKFNNFKRRKF